MLRRRCATREELHHRWARGGSVCCGLFLCRCAGAGAGAEELFCSGHRSSQSNRIQGDWYTCRSDLASDDLLSSIDASVAWRPRKPTWRSRGCERPLHSSSL